MLKMNISIVRLAKHKPHNNSSLKAKNGVKNTSYFLSSNNLIIRKSNFRPNATAQTSWKLNGSYESNRPFYMKYYASNQPHSLSIKDMEQFRLNSEKMLANECEAECRKQIEMIKSFLVDELLIRCANVIVENKELPRALRENDHFQRLEANYKKVTKSRNTRF